MKINEMKINENNVVNIDLQTRKRVKMRKTHSLIYNKYFFRRQDGGLRGNHFAEAAGFASSKAFIMYLRSIMGIPCFATADTQKTMLQL
jgi:hypothetical protein